MNDTRTRTVDVAVIGAGTAGLAAYRAARKAGKRALLIEAGAYGTTCARVGCMPSKLLIAAAEAAHHATHARPFGVSATVAIDGRAVMDRVRSERDRFVGFVIESVDNIPPEHRLTGRARFTGPDALDVDGTRVEAPSIVIATGSSPFIPPVFDAIRDRLIVNDDVFAWEDLPRSVAVFGAGVIGLELGQALHRLGVRVRVFGRSGTVGPLGDPVVKEAAAAALRAELDVDFDAKVRAVEPEGKTGVAVRFADADGNERVEHFEAALIAAGRRPNLFDLGVERAGIGPDATIDRETLRWGDTHVFVAGDANDDAPLLHEAADEGTIAGDNAARFPDVRTGKRRTPLAIAFTEPALAVVAGGFRAVSERGPFVVGQVDFGDQGRSRIMLQNKGVARLYADPRSRRFLGAEIAGPRAEHLAHLLAWAHQAELTIDQMLAMPFYHPVVEEGLRTALRDVAAKLDAETTSAGAKTGA
ncbi:MAG: dihydrolipoyl dehydrogenase [Labilithrix sp.]|nr:dihydrolipoyl dehydrogenase [Labilithrix sp.]